MIFLQKSYPTKDSETVRITSVRASRIIVPALVSGLKEAGGISLRCLIGKIMLISSVQCTWKLGEWGTWVACSSLWGMILSLPYCRNSRPVQSFLFPHGQSLWTPDWLHLQAHIPLLLPSVTLDTLDPGLSSQVHTMFLVLPINGPIASPSLSHIVSLKQLHCPR